MCVRRLLDIIGNRVYSINMKICKATLKDCKEIHKLSFVPGLANQEGYPPPRCWMESFVREKQYAYVIRDDKEVVAFILGERTCGGIGLVWMLGVEKSHQGKGLGTSILEYAAKQMKADGLRVVIVYGYTKNPAIKHILKKLDFQAGCTYVEYVKFLA